MKICADNKEGVLYIRLCGEVDEHNAATARRDADKLAENFAPRTNRAVIDLNSVSFMDSTGIGFLIGRYKKFSRYGIAVYLTNPSQAADRILQMSGVYAIMPKI